MDMEIVRLWDSAKATIKEEISKRVYEDDWTIYDYDGLLTLVLECMLSYDYEDEFAFDTEKISVIDNGDYQGAMLFIIPKNEYQTNNYWMTWTGYGSCSYCDVMQGIAYDDETSEQKIDDLMTLGLHMIQRIKKILQVLLNYR